MRIGVLTTSFPRFEGDVAGVFVLEMCRALASRGHLVEVLAPQPRDFLRPYDPGAGVRVVHVPYSWPRSSQRTFYGAGAPDNLAVDTRAWGGAVGYSLLLTGRALRALGRWDAVVSHWLLPSSLAAVVASRIARKPIAHLAVSHSADTHLLSRAPGRSQVAAAVLSGSTAMLFASTQGRERFAALLDARGRTVLNTRAHVRPMGIEPPEPRSESDRTRIRRELGLDGFVLLALGRLVGVKGVSDLATALGAEPGVTVVVAGDGPQRDAVARAFVVSGTRAHMLGVVNGRDKRDLLAAADALVIPSRVLEDGRSEGAPTVAVQAMAVGLPVIATRVGGIPELLGEGGLGVLVPPADPIAMRAAIRAARDDPGRLRELGRRAAGHVRQYFWSALAPWLETLLAERPH